jgi:hypothetical protein
MEGKVVTDRDLRVIEYLQDSWQSLRDTTPDVTASIAKFITDLPEQYKKLAINLVANHINNTMGLHFLTLLATFEEKADQDGISPEDCQETLADALPETLRILGKITTHLSIQSLDDLGTLCNIASSLITLTETSSAEEAENWIDSLPALYYRQLERKNFISKDFLDWTQPLDKPETVQLVTISTDEIKQLVLQVSLKLEKVKLLVA